ncbi:hypothetical protein JY651_31505 [Pyxidicoccus parkwayensis]|uniref:Uncharacterized protein n=1 Tax=Pyxidicoccus parkwayensis TaxID=2813578 RepID=A0ABX7NN12_9BACT|nr:hypothetical protein [Pyxidicoccus parkwaysis]QSQ19798.1 hypothetical protein JY651_31505 [Pyxidicoccus parkwaysis]
MPSSPEPSPSQRPSVGRSAALGLCVGLLLGGLGLLLAGLRALFLAVDCSGLGGPECELLQQATREIGRMQTLAGGALIALGASLFVLLRPRPPKPPESPGAP